jgi:hypothetical protein
VPFGGAEKTRQYRVAWCHDWDFPPMPCCKTVVTKITHHTPDVISSAFAIDGQDRHFGSWDVPASHEQADRFIAESLSGGAVEAAEQAAKTPKGVSVVEIVLAYLTHIEGYYVKDGQPTSEVEIIHDALKLLRGLRDGVR